MQDQQTAVAPATFESIVNEALRHLDIGNSGAIPDDKPYQIVHDARIKEIAAAVATLPEITDAKTYEANQKARTRLVSIRGRLNDRRKELFAPIRALQERVNAYIGTTADTGLQGRIKALEVQIEAKQKAWNDKQERARQEAMRVIDERNAARARRLLDAGMTFDGSAYRLVDVMLYQRDVNAASDAEFDQWCHTTLSGAIDRKAEADRIAAEQERREREVKEAKEAAARAEHEAMQRRFAEQAEIQRRQDEERAELDRQRQALEQERLRIQREAEALEAAKALREQAAAEAEAQAEREAMKAQAIVEAGPQDPQEIAAPEYDLGELLSCALALLDEANRAFTALGGDEYYSGSLAQIQSMAGACVQLAREIQD